MDCLEAQISVRGSLRRSLSSFGLRDSGWGHMLRRCWVEKRFDNLDEQGFPQPLPEDKLPESQIDGSYSVEPGNLNELSTWQLMAESGEMTEEALRQCSRMPSMEYEESGLLHFQKVVGAFGHINIL